MLLEYINKLLILSVLFLSHSLANDKTNVELSILESRPTSDPFSNDIKPTGPVYEEIARIELKTKSMALFFEGLVNLDLYKGGQSIPFMGKPIHIRVIKNGVELKKSIYFIYGYEQGFYLLSQNTENHRELAYLHNKEFTSLIVNFLEEHVADLKQYKKPNH